jgi:hypothetical protein
VRLTPVYLCAMLRFLQIREVVIPNLITELSKAGIKGLDEYEGRLRNNAGDRDVLGDLLFEANVSLMFSRHGFQVTIREKPDIMIEHNGEIAYAEVKHFREKVQDILDEKAMRESNDLIPVSVLTPTEGAEAWDQIADVAVKKKHQYQEDAPNLLVIATSSDAVSGVVVQTAGHIINEKAYSDPQLRKLNALMLIDQWITRNKNVDFYRTAYGTTPMSMSFITKLENIQFWVTPREIMNIRYS